MAAVQFQAHVDLLRLFLTNREAIVDRIEALLNAQRKPVRYRSLLANDFEKCFTANQAPFKGLEETHWEAGFKPRQVQHVYNDLIDPIEMMLRAVHCWQQTKWPSRSDRLHYAHTLFSLYVLRWLQFLSLRLWDDDSSNAGQRLTEIQAVLDELWRTSPPDQPAFVRDARWLIPLALSLITDELAPYFDVARRVTDSLPEADALETQKASVRMLGGHLTSQIRYYSTKDGVSIDENSVVVRTRTSNALDLALLVQGLVALLKAYDQALQSGDERLRLDMAGAIFQGISPDPELFLNRRSTNVLSAYTMIELVFIAPDEPGQAAYTPNGQRHLQLLCEYGSLIERLLASLREDFRHFKPVDGGCSPYGVLFGLPSNLLEHMALKAIDTDAETRFSLEDVFKDDVDANTRAGKLDWVNGWRKLPHIGRDVQKMYDYPQQFAEELYSRIERQLSGDSIAQTGRLYIASNSDSSSIPEAPARYFVSSDKQLVAAHKAEPYDRAQLLRDRQEGHFLVSWETPGGWTGLKKSLLAEVIGKGRDARIVGLPAYAAQVLQLMCIDLVVPSNLAR